jgi:hypothetical protein
MGYGFQIRKVITSYKQEKGYFFHKVLILGCFKVNGIQK